MKLKKKWRKNKNYQRVSRFDLLRFKHFSTNFSTISKRVSNSNSDLVFPNFLCKATLQILFRERWKTEKFRGLKRKESETPAGLAQLRWSMRRSAEIGKVRRWIGTGAKSSWPWGAPVTLRLTGTASALLCEMVGGRRRAFDRSNQSHTWTNSSPIRTQIARNLQGLLDHPEFSIHSLDTPFFLQFFCMYIV